MTTIEEAMRDIRIGNAAVAEVLHDDIHPTREEAEDAARIASRRSREETEAVLRPVIEKQRVAIAKLHAHLSNHHVDRTGI